MSAAELSFSTAALERFKVAAQSRLSAQVLQSVQVRVAEDFLTQDLLVAIEAYVYGQHQTVRPGLVGRDITIEVPATWWQALKLAALVAGNPFIDADKIRYTTIRRHVEVDVMLERNVTWPDLPFAVPKDWGQTVVIALPSSVDWWVAP